MTPYRQRLAAILSADAAMRAVCNSMAAEFTASAIRAADLRDRVEKRRPCHECRHLVDMPRGDKCAAPTVVARRVHLQTDRVEYGMTDCISERGGPEVYARRRCGWMGLYWRRRQ